MLGVTHVKYKTSMAARKQQEWLMWNVSVLNDHSVRINYGILAYIE